MSAATLLSAGMELQRLARRALALVVGEALLLSAGLGIVATGERWEAEP